MIFLQNEVAGNQLLTAVGRHGIDAREIRDERVRIAADDAGLAVDRDAGEVADVLIGAGELVEERRLAAVLVAYEREGEHRVVRERIAAALRVELALLAEAGVLLAVLHRLPDVIGRLFFAGLDLDPVRIRKTQREHIAVQAQLHRVSHRGELLHRDLRAGEHAHIQKMLAQRAFTADGGDDAGLADAKLL